MINNISSILDKLGFGLQKRAISIQLSNAAVNSQIMLQRLEGYHGINDGLSLELICLSTNPYIELKQWTVPGLSETFLFKLGHLT